MSSKTRSVLLVTTLVLATLALGAPATAETPPTDGQPLALEGLIEGQCSDGIPPAPAPVETSGSCYDECYEAHLTCPQTCGGTPAQCFQAYQVCYQSCNNGVGPWLPC